MGSHLDDIGADLCSHPFRLLAASLVRPPFDVFPSLFRPRSNQAVGKARPSLAHYHTLDTFTDHRHLAPHALVVPDEENGHRAVPAANDFSSEGIGADELMGRSSGDDTTGLAPGRSPES